MSEITNEEVTKRLQELTTGKIKLLKPGSTNTKLKKNEVDTFIMNLIPHKANSKSQNLCPGASPSCIKACLNTSGHGRFNMVQHTRLLNTEVYVQHTKAFCTILQRELEKLNQKAGKANTKYAIRMNGTSDEDWVERIKQHTGVDILAQYTNLIQYAYTKRFKLWDKYNGTSMHTTFSRSENNWLACQWVLGGGSKGIPGSVAVVFYPKVPDTYMGYKCIDGDSSDERWKDPQGVIIGLKYKRVSGVNPLTDPFVVKV